MKIKVPFERERSVEDYVVGELDDSDYGSGKLEDMDRSLNKTKEAFGRLCDLLAKQGILDAVEITYIAKGWENDEAVFVDGEKEQD